MKYSVLFKPKAETQLEKLDLSQRKIILKWVKKHLVDCADPWVTGKALTGSLYGLWCYRVGDYRLIADIKESEISIEIVNIGHRRQVYKQR